MKIAILTRPDYRSPRILAESLQLQLKKQGATVDVFYNIDTLTRLYSYREKKYKFKFHFWLRRKLINFLPDRKLLRILKHYDAIIISECTPNGFWKDLYNIEKLRELISKPVIYYEVYYLGNAPTQLAALKASGNPLIERYDWHLAVAEVTEIKCKESGPWSCIGLDLTESNLKPTVKDEFFALVDFMQPDYESYQFDQIRVLEELQIKTVVLKERYSLSEIRELYNKASIFFIQFPEAFGLPIAECLASGVQIFTANSGWPMSWRLDNDPAVHSEGTLPNVFSVYSSKEDLKEKLIDFLSNYDKSLTPFNIFSSFVKYYPHYYYGNPSEIKKLILNIKSRYFD
jgi:hypothetical protein